MKISSIYLPNGDELGGFKASEIPNTPSTNETASPDSEVELWGAVYKLSSPQSHDFDGSGMKLL